MARSIQQIYQSILSTVQSNPTLSQLTSTSQVAIFGLWCYITAVSQNTEEVLYDDFVAQIEGIINTLPPASGMWIQSQAFQFQYSATTPQILQFMTASTTWAYPITNNSLQIISNCAVVSPNPGIVLIKVATGGTTPAALSTLQLSAFQNYFNTIAPDGIIYSCISLPADLIYIVLTVSAQGIYSASLPQNLLTAFNTYLQNLPFNGVIKYIDILIALRNVPGVIDIVINQLWARNASQSFGSGVQMILNNTINIWEYNPSAGYATNEASPNNLISGLNVIYY